MLLPDFDYHEPLNLEEACTILAELGSKAKLLAGGTDLIVNMKKKVLSPEHLVSLSRIEELRRIDCDNGAIKIGGCCTAAELADSQETRKELGALSSGAGGLGSPLIRNLATLAGNIVTARPAADLPPSLMAYSARVVLRNAAGERSVSLEDFFQGPGATVIAPDEILTHVIVDRPPPHSGAGYSKLGVRKTLEISIVNVAAHIALNGSDGTIQSVRILLGAVAPVPIRASTAEKMLAGEKPSDALFAAAGDAAAADCRPIDDFRASAEYRREMVKVLTRRMLNIAFNEAQAT
jgi:carbon-monoxide dehydrogenase medium subunit